MDTSSWKQGSASTALLLHYLCDTPLNCSTLVGAIGVAMVTSQKIIWVQYQARLELAESFTSCWFILLERESRVVRSICLVTPCGWECDRGWVSGLMSWLLMHFCFALICFKDSGTRACCFLAMQHPLCAKSLCSRSPVFHMVLALGFTGRLRHSGAGAWTQGGGVGPSTAHHLQRQKLPQNVVTCLRNILWLKALVHWTRSV